MYEEHAWPAHIHTLKKQSRMGPRPCEEQLNCGGKEVEITPDWTRKPLAGVHATRDKKQHTYKEVKITQAGYYTWIFYPITCKMNKYGIIGTQVCC